MVHVTWTRRAAALVVLALTLLLPNSLPANDRGHDHGRVVDAATRQPIEGAVVTVIWMKAPLFSMDGVKDHMTRSRCTSGSPMSIESRWGWNA
jgi:hypothetical protein